MSESEKGSPRRKWVRRLYSGLHMLPLNWQLKLKTVGCALCGQWAFADSAYCAPYPERIDEGEVRDVFAALPPESLAAVLKFARQQNLINILFDPECPLGYEVMLKRRFMYPGGMLDVIKQERRAMRAARRKYHLESDVGSPPALVYRHGIPVMPSGVTEYMKDKDFFDLGACSGDSTLALLEYSPRRVLAFEPSAKNRERFAAVMRRNSVDPGRWRLEPCGVGATAGNAVFPDTGDGANSLLVGEGDSSAEVVTLDEYGSIGGIRAGFIKADLEGMGLSAVRGALRLIGRDRPVLSLSIYHSRDELFGIYPLLKSTLDNYEYRVQPEACGCFELALLAWPKEAEEGQ